MKIAPLILGLLLAPLALAAEAPKKKTPSLFDRLKKVVTPTPTPTAEPEAEPTPTPVPSPKLPPKEPLPEPTSAPEPSPSAAARNWHLGPVFSLGFPHVYTLALESKLGQSWSLALAGGKLGFDYKALGVGMNHVEARVHHYPGSGVFFWGFATGWKTFFVKAGKELDLLVVKYAAPISLEYNVGSFYLTPQIGWDHRFDIGLFLGFELGWEFAALRRETLEFAVIDKSVEVQVQNDQTYKDLTGRMSGVGRFLGGLDLPYFALRVGWLF